MAPILIASLYAFNQGGKDPQLKTGAMPTYNKFFSLRVIVRVQRCAWAVL